MSVLGRKLMSDGGRRKPAGQSSCASVPAYKYVQQHHTQCRWCSSHWRYREFDSADRDRANMSPVAPPRSSAAHPSTDPHTRPPIRPSINPPTHPRRHPRVQLKVGAMDPHVHILSLGVIETLRRGSKSDLPKAAQTDGDDATSLRVRA
eukprot:GHVU01087272.1.p2 GENE.GHVU01087272.1~~GHVU01087272.1.p2  ORF type:complete len:149 (+),score=8.52 GHVU01087272.1:428-874(+)